MSAPDYRLGQLEVLESEAVYIMREVAADAGASGPAVLRGQRLDRHAPPRGEGVPSGSHSVSRHACRHRAQLSGVLRFRDRRVTELGVQLIVASVEDAIQRGLVTPEPNGSRNRIQTPVLLEAVEKHRFTALFGGARRDEEKARAKERIFSFRDEFGQWDPKNQRPELWDLYNGRIHLGESIRVFPLSNWTELDVWSYIAQEGLALPEIYYAHDREVFERQGMLFAANEFCRPRSWRSRSWRECATARWGTRP